MGGSGNGVTASDSSSGGADGGATETADGYFTVTWYYTGLQPDLSSYNLGVRCVCNTNSLTNEDPYEFDLGGSTNTTGFDVVKNFILTPSQDANGEWSMSWTTPYMRASADYAYDGNPIKPSSGAAYIGVPTITIPPSEGAPPN